MILVVGATGPLGLGREIVRRLADEGEPVRALVRSTSDIEAVNVLKALGAETIEGDLREPSTLRAACDGVDTVITTATSMMSAQPGDSIAATDLRGQQNLIDAALRADVQRFIYVSYSRGLDTPSPLTRAKRTVERYLRDSRMSYTILRPTFFMETWLSPAVGFDYEHARVMLFGTGDKPISWVSLHDVADFAVRCVHNPAAHDRILELGGPDTITPNDAVRIFEEVARRRFTVELMPEETLRTDLVEETDPVQESFTGLEIDYAKGDAIDMTETLRAFPVRLVSVRDYAEGVVPLPMS